MVGTTARTCRGDRSPRRGDSGAAGGVNGRRFCKGVLGSGGGGASGVIEGSLVLTHAHAHARFRLEGEPRRVRPRRRHRHRSNDLKRRF